MAQGRVAVRDSKNRTGPTLLFGPAVRERFVSDVGTGRVDPLRPAR